MAMLVKLRDECLKAASEAMGRDEGKGKGHASTQTNVVAVESSGESQTEEMPSPPNAVDQSPADNAAEEPPADEQPPTHQQPFLQGEIADEAATVQTKQWLGQNVELPGQSPDAFKPVAYFGTQPEGSDRSCYNSPPPNYRVDADAFHPPHFGQVADQQPPPMEPQPQQDGQGVQQQQHQQLHQQEADVVESWEKPVAHPKWSVSAAYLSRPSPDFILSHSRIDHVYVRVMDSTKVVVVLPSSWREFSTRETGDKSKHFHRGSRSSCGFPFPQRAADRSTALHRTVDGCPSSNKRGSCSPKRRSSRPSPRRDCQLTHILLLKNGEVDVHQPPPSLPRLDDERFASPRTARADPPNVKIKPPLPRGSPERDAAGLHIPFTGPFGPSSPTGSHPPPSYLPPRSSPSQAPPLSSIGHTDKAPDSPASDAATTTSTTTPLPFLATLEPGLQLAGSLRAVRQGQKADVDVWTARATGEGATPAGTWVVTKSVSGLVQAGVGREKVRAAVQRDSDTLRLLYFAASEFRQHRLPDLLHGRRHTGVRRCVPEWLGFLSQEELAAGKAALRETREGGTAVSKRMTDLVAEEGVCYLMGMVMGTTDPMGQVWGADTVDHLCRPPIPSRRPPGPLLRGAVSVNMVLALLHIHRHHHITHNDFHYRNVLVADVETARRQHPRWGAPSRHPLRPPFTTAYHLDATLEGRELVDETVTYATDCMGAAFSFILLASPTAATAKAVIKLAETELEELLKGCEAARSQQGEGEAAQATREGAREAYKATVASIAAAASSHMEQAIEASEQPEAAKQQWKALCALSVQLYRELGMGHGDGMGQVEMWARLDTFYHDVMTELFSSA
ncbi:unnamed protein product [Vitrella brassicaformis CCMP3155]|uniref:Protein kinase domain-containing protein n=1 Tax=Vitrella brassicaformis (strain CCMP3155) TaxID=1169540 RepID=A0A0G4FYZ3_VITBC|nr:unnamed protein product [Vitrella brassicaformis CCMP3155]|eukprot:CEM20840.1 unnamed protein product [Vitrella brassicaformis CCMP3155]